MPTYALLADNLSMTGPRKTGYIVRCERCGSYLGLAGWGDGQAIVSHLTLEHVVASLLAQSPPLAESVRNIKEHESICSGP